jgi:hypothetical protein
MKAIIFTIFSMAVFASTTAYADDSPSYSYVEISAIDYDVDIDGIDSEPDGEKLKLSVELGSSLFAFVDRVDTDGSYFGGSFDLEKQGYGFGLRGDSWYASYSYNTWELGNHEFDVDTLRLGFRNYLTQNIEFNASYGWNNIEDTDNDDGFQVGFVFELTDVIHLTAEYESISGDLDVDYASVGIRLSF